jgi:hypothetical protein
MKKLFTLMTLLLCAVVSKADDVTVTWTMGETTTGEANPATAATDIKFTLGSDLTNEGAYNWSEIDFTKLQPVSGDKGKNGRSNLIANRYVDFTFTPAGGNFTPTQVSFDVIKIGTGDPTIVVDFIDGTGETINVTSNDAAIRRNNDSETTAINQSYTITGAAASANAVTLRIYIGKLANNKQVGIANVIISGTLVSDNEPILSATTDAITFALNPVVTEESAEFTITGKNLTDGTYNLDIPEVEGLSVLPTSFTVTGGEVSQKFTVTYNGLTNGTANITAKVGDLTATVVVNYSNRTDYYTLATVSDATTWDWKDWNETVELKDDESTKLSSTEQYVYSDIVDIYNLTAPSNFDTKAIAFKGQYPVRAKKSQAGTWTISTTVPGTLEVDFSDTGNSTKVDGVEISEEEYKIEKYKRYLTINGNKTKYYTARTGSSNGRTTAKLYVPAGEINISATQAICMYKITFTPATETPVTSVTVGETGYRTFASSYPLDFTTPIEGLKAYTAEISEGQVTFNEVKGTVLAGEGLLLKAAEGEYTLNVATAMPAAIDNAFESTLVDKVVEGAGIFVLMDGANGVGFYKTTAEIFIVGANTAYLPALASEARFIAIDGEATGIVAVGRDSMRQDNELYNLQGQRMAKAQKGLYIVNGKKVVMK